MIQSSNIDSRPRRRPGGRCVVGPTLFVISLALSLSFLLTGTEVLAQECTTNFDCDEVCFDGGECLLGTCYCNSSPPPPPPPPPSDVLADFTALTLNTWMLDVPGLDIPGPIPDLDIGDSPCMAGRSTHLGELLSQYHDFGVVMIQELFQDDARGRVHDQIKNKYPYRIYQQPGGRIDLTPWDPEFKINGGLAILSKYPFLSVSSRNYYAEAWQECDGNFADCGANKGFLHVRINVNGVPVNVISLHAQANYGGGTNTWTQQQQMHQLKAYISSFPRAGWAADLSRELLIMGGDYNIRAHCATCYPGGDYFSVGGILGMREAWREEHCVKYPNSKYTWFEDGRTKGGLSSQADENHRLDMIFYDDSKSHLELRPSFVDVERFPVRRSIWCTANGPVPYPYLWDELYISDHYGVHAKFTVYRASAAPSEGSCGVVPSYAPWPKACFTPPISEPGPPPVQVSFDAACSSDRDGRIVSYRWREDDGTVHNGRVFSKTYWSQGDHGVELTVTDNDGYTATNYALTVVCSCCGQEICACCIE